MSLELPNKILILDRDQALAQGLKVPLERYSIITSPTRDVNSAIYLFNQNIFPVALIEMDLDEMPGIVLAQKWRQSLNLEKRNTGIIIMVGNRSKLEGEKLRLIEEIAAAQIIYKPFTATQLIPMIHKAMKLRNRNIKVAELGVKIQTIASDPKNLSKAIDMVKAQADQIGPQSFDMIRNLYERHEKWEEALQLVHDQLRKFPEKTSLLSHKGRLLLKLGATEEALQALEQADQLAPNNIDRMNEMAMAYLQAQKPDLSVEKMRELIKFHPEDPDYKFKMFGELVKAGFDQHAQNLCHETTTPMEVIRHYNNLGVALAKSGKLDEAISEYKKCIAFCPKNKEIYRIHYNIALAYIAKKNPIDRHKALRSLDTCLHLKPEFEKAIRTRSQLTMKNSA